MTVLLTGCAGFIGSHLLDYLLENNHRVIGVDDFNDYYHPKIKEKNVSKHLTNPDFSLHRLDISTDHLSGLANKSPEIIVHLAARAGVRASIQQPLLYEKVNIAGTLHLLELAKKLSVKHFIFGSSSSVYGNNTPVPFRENAPCDQPISPYATTKRSAELLCYTYHKLYQIPVTILRFFTVYGPRNRPDMAAYKFMDAIYREKPIEVYGNGTSRDYTFVDDITTGIASSVKLKNPRFETINLGNSSPVYLNELISLIEETVGKEAIIIKKSLPSGDVISTFADISKAKNLLHWRPKTDLKTGLAKLYQWYTNNKTQ